jgi:choline dehydrogenase-like flavoprotein
MGFIDSLDAPRINSGGKDEHTFDAIVIGSGMTGGWAAKEFCEKGLRTLVLERGRDIEHVKDYPTANLAPWQLEHRDRLTAKTLEENPIVSRCYAFTEATQHFFVKDKEHPYIQIKPFDWIKGYQAGGKSLMWARWTQRWSDLDFEANAKQGIGVDWPIRYKDIEPWYSYVEKFVGISGSKEGIPHLPDGEFLPPMEMNCIEKHFKSSVETSYPGRHVIICRTANLTKGLNGRGPCQYRDLCSRGCPFAGYFSSVSASLPAARATGNMVFRPHSVVHSIIYDDKKKRATGVRIIDARSKAVTEYFAKIIFLNAGTINTTLILLNSISSAFPNGLGNTNDILGRYLMDHNYRPFLSGIHEGYTDQYYYGKRPTGIYIPRFRNLGNDKQLDFTRGYSFGAGGSRSQSNINDGIGAAYKEQLTELGPWNMWMVGMGECLPYADNRITLSKDQKDDWEMPLVEIDCEYKTEEVNMLKDILTSGSEMLEKAGFKNIFATDRRSAPGQGIHEMGTVRMGRDPKTSILNEFNQVWDAKNLFVTDGACMASNACQNPSITYMALTARAADHAVSELKKGNL